LERRVKRWNHAKKEALIRGDFEAIHAIVKSERQRREKAKRSKLASTSLRSARRDRS
jgi:hypothetical protein